MLSYWEKKIFFENIDIAIIGSGIVGLNAAIELKNMDKNLRVTVFERGFLPYGASTRNAGFACFGSLTELIDDLSHSSENEVFALAERRFRGLEKLRKVVGDKEMCYEENGGFEIFREEDADIFETCKDKIDYFNQNFSSFTNTKNTYKTVEKSRIQSFGFQGITNVIHNTAEGQIDTGKTMQKLLILAQEKGIKIINGLNLTKLTSQNDEVILEAADWSFSAKKVLVCTNGFAKNLLPDLEVNPARNQVLITKPIENLRLKGCFHYDRGYFYFRNIDNRILLGGGRNLDYETEQTEHFGTTPLIQNALQELLHGIILPNQPIEIDMVWSGILGLGAVKKPIIEMVDNRIGVAVRMGGMGVAIGSLVGEDGAKMIYA